MSPRKKSGVKDALILCIVWIILTQFFSWLVFNRLRLTEPDKRQNDPEKGLVSTFIPHPLNFLEMHARQDSAWYFSVAYEGYSYNPGKQSNVSFFPLYPVLMRFGNKLLEPTGIMLYYRYLIAGSVISIISLVGAMIYLFKLLKLEGFKENYALLCVFLILIFPASYFFTAVYSESLFLFLVVAFFYYYKKRMFYVTSLLGFLATLARPTGIFLLVPLIYEYVRLLNTLSVKDSIMRMIPILSTSLGLLTYMYFLAQKFGDALLFVKAQTGWGRVPFLSLKTFAFLLTYIQKELAFNSATSANMIIEIIFLAFGVSMSIFVMKKIGMFYGLWCIVNVLFPLTSGVLASQGRYTLVVFPLFMGLTLLISKNINIKYAYIMSSVMILGLNTVLFVNGYWSI